MGQVATVLEDYHNGAAKTVEILNKIATKIGWYANISFILSLLSYNGFVGSKIFVFANWMISIGFFFYLMRIYILELGFFSRMTKYINGEAPSESNQSKSSHDDEQNQTEIELDFLSHHSSGSKSD